MTTRPHPVQPLRPTTFAQWWCTTFHRHPVTFIPHWDTIDPPEMPVIDVDAAWRDLAEQIDRLAAAGALDDAHGDLVDRLIAPIAAGWRIRVDQRQKEPRLVLALLEEQGEEHRTRLGRRLNELRKTLDGLTDLYHSTWDSLVGLPAGTSTAPPRPQTLPEPMGRAERTPDSGPQPATEPTVESASDAARESASDAARETVTDATRDPATDPVTEVPALHRAA